MYYQGILINCQTKGLIFLMNVVPEETSVPSGGRVQLFFLGGVGGRVQYNVHI